jgi:hypothetical protein
VRFALESGELTLTPPDAATFCRAASAMSERSALPCDYIWTFTTGSN